MSPIQEVSINNRDVWLQLTGKGCGENRRCLKPPSPWFSNTTRGWSRHTAMEKAHVAKRFHCHHVGDPLKFVIFDYFELFIQNVCMLNSRNAELD